MDALFPQRKCIFYNVSLLVLLTVIDSGDIFPRSVDKFVTWSVPIYDGGEGLLVNITEHRGQTCRCIKPHYHDRKINSQH